MSHHGGGGAGAMSEVMMVGEGDQRGKEKERELCTGDALGPEKQEMGGGDGKWEVEQQGQGGYRTAAVAERASQLPGRFEGGLIMASAGRGRSREGGQEAEQEMKMFFHLLPGAKGPGCDRENDGKSHWSCWFERVCLWNKLFISQP